MKVIYEFDLYEDREELEIFQKAQVNAASIDGLKAFLRRAMKHGELSEDKYSAYNDVEIFLNGY